MKVFFISAIIYFSAFSVYAQINVLDASTLAAALKDQAHSVKREEAIIFDVKDIDNAKYSVHRVITVLDAEGEDELFFQKSSDQFRRLEDAEIKVFDAQGKPINKYKLKEMKSLATGDGLVVDGKVYYFRVAAPSYPITVQVDYEVKYKGTLNYPDYWIGTPDQSIENSSYTAIIPAGLDLKFKPKNIKLSPSIKDAGKNKVYSFTVKNMKAVRYEEGAVSPESSYPSVQISPNKFSMDGNEGELNSWKGLGTWYRSLSKGSLNLSEESKSYMREMVADAGSDKEKMKILYSYLQGNFRYVSIQLGIGGFKPFDAKFVDQKKYGDCKALSNYMQACLDAVGIVSYPALINAEYNKEPVDPTFPHNSFNHVIICVPGKKDSTWLECTSSSADFGVLGSFTENRNALLVTPEGGVLVATPKSKSSENTFNLTTNIWLKEDGSGKSESVLKATGLYKEDVISNIVDEKKDDQKEYLVDRLAFLQPDEFELAVDQKSDSIKTTFSLLIEKIPEFTAGSKMFLNPRIYKIWNGRLPNTENRTKSFYFQSPFIKTDTTVYFLPEDYTIATLPTARNVHSEYGLFKSTYSYNEKDNSITTTAWLQLSQHIIPAEKFAETRTFFSKVIEEYSEKIIVKKK